MKIITIACLKGGVAKTTLALNLGYYLKSKKKKVLFIDLDLQANLSSAFKINDDDVKFGASDLLEHKATAKDCIINDVIVANQELAYAEAYLLSCSIGREYKLKEALKTISKDYDYVVIDTPPSTNNIILNALVCTDYLLIPTEASEDGFNGAKATIENYEAVKQYYNHDINLLGIAINRYNKRSIMQNQFMNAINDLAKSKGTSVYKTAIRQCQAFAEAKAMQESIYDYAPKSNGALDTKAIFNEIYKQINK